MDEMEDGQAEMLGSQGAELAPSTPSAGDTITEPTTSPGGQPLLSEYIDEAERYQEERYGTSFCIKDGRSRATEEVGGSAND